MNKVKYIFLLGLMFGISSCGILFDDPITRFWNNGGQPSENEVKVYSYCRSESEKIYPALIDQDGSKRILYRRNCMEKMGYW